MLCFRMLAIAIAVQLAVNSDGLFAAPARNVLLLVSDNQNQSDCGCYGNTVVKTPNINRLAAEGVLFNHGFATTASCGPSRAVIYTGLLTPANGQYGHGHGVHTFRLNPKTQTVYSMLQAQGYETALLGKQHLSPIEQYPLTFTKKVNPRDVMGLAAAGKEFIQRAQLADKPFFLTIGYSDPHPTSRDGAEWGIVRKYNGVVPEQYDATSLQVPDYLPNKPWVKEGLAGYYQLISRMDAGVGRMLDVLKETGTAEDTLVIFTSDHGSSEPGAMANHYEPGIRVPFIVRDPTKQQQGTKTNAMATLADITPTILDWTQHQTSYKLDGRSVLPIMDQQDPEGWDEVFLSHVCHEVTMYYPMRTLRTRRHKLIWNLAWRMEFPNPIDTLARQTWVRTIKNKETMIGKRTVSQFLFRDELELYDLQADPNETKNIAFDSENAGLTNELLGELKKYCSSSPDPWMDRHEVPTLKSAGRHSFK